MTGFTIDVKHDIARHGRRLTKIQRLRVLPKAAAWAMNRTMAQVETAARKEIARASGMKQKDVKAAMTREKATWRRMRAVVRTEGKALNLIRFKARQTRRGVTANAWGKRKVYRGTFIGNQGRTVFVRKTAKSLPIRPVYGPALPKVMADPIVSEKLRVVVAERWPVNFDQGLTYFLAKEAGVAPAPKTIRVAV